MATPPAPTQWYQGKNALSAFLIVLTSALILVLLVWRSVFDPLPNEYSVHFGNAQWIEPKVASPTGYFRRSFHIPSDISQAWIQISASDSFTLFVNGNEVASENYISGRVTGQHDITKHLHTGKNAVAVRVARLSYPGSSQLIFRLGYRNLAGQWREIESGSEWKASPIPLDVPGSFSWLDTRLDDTLWPEARTVPESAPPTQTSPLNPLILKAVPEGSWITGPSPNQKEVVFQKTFSMNPSNLDSWVQIATNGEYDLMINNRLPVSRQPPTEGFDLYPVTNWLQKGSNEVLVRIRTESGMPALLLNVTSVSEDGRLSYIPTDTSWTTRIETKDDSFNDPDQGANMLGSYGIPPWGFLPKTLQLAEMSSRMDAMRASLGALAVLAIIVSVFLLWWGSARARSQVRRVEIQRALSQDAVFHLPFIVVAMFVFLLGFDIRFQSDWAYQERMVLTLLALFLFLKVTPWLTGTGPDAAADQNRAGRPASHARFGWALSLTVIMILGVSVRLNHLGFLSLHHDEVSILKMAKGILSSGYPHAVIGHFDKALTTYEVVPYPIALSVWLFGDSEWAVRISSVLFGAVTLLMIGMIGRRLFDPPTGLLAAAIYAFNPWSIQWAQNAFYPQQTQAWALLTLWLFHEAIRGHAIHHRYLIWTTAGFILTYLSWEGSGFLLPAMGLFLLISRWGNWSWIRDRVVWGCAATIVAVVSIQFSYRVLSGLPYRGIGAGLSQVGLPTPFFLDSMYDPTFYIRNFLTLENHLPLTLVVLFSAFFFRRHASVRYLGSLLLMLLFFYTNFLSESATRYVYFIQPLLILLASALAVMIGSRILNLAVDSNRLTVWTARAGAFSLLALLFISSNTLILKTYRLSSSPAFPFHLSRLGVYPIDYRGPSVYVKNHWRPGDAVIPGIPHTYEHYSGMAPDYYINTLLAQRIIYDSGFPVPVFVDRFSGKPVLRNAREFEDVLYQTKRTWVIAAPLPLFTALNETFVMDILRRRAKVVFESYDAQVYLWESGPPHAEITRLD